MSGSDDGGGGSPELGPLNIDYFGMYEDSGSTGRVFCIILFLAWSGYLVYLLGHTAGTYFSPALGSICEKLNLPYNIAGVTFLAMGNGAPDVFATMASFGGAGDVLIGIGCLLGASMFINTIAVGSVLITSPCSINPRDFVRDVAFQILGVLSLGLVAALGRVNIFIAICYFLVYAGYVALVVYSWRVDASLEAMIAAASQKSTVQAAFWHQSDKSKSKASSSSIGSSKGGLAKAVGGNVSDSLYTFLILNEDGEADELSDDDPGETTINLSGGLISPIFDHDIYEDYFSAPPPKTAAEEGLSSAGSKGSSTGFGGNKQVVSNMDPKSNTIQTSSSSKLPGFDGISSSFGRENSIDSSQRSSSNESNTGKRSISSDATGMNKDRILAAMYWQQLQLKRRLQRHMISSEFWDLDWYLQILEVIDLPAVILRDITIPTTDDALWSRYFAFLQIIFAPIFILEVTGLSEDYVGALPITVFYMILSIIPAAAVYLTTHNNKPPSGTYGIVWVLFSFTMCIAWIYLLAGELVACLSAVGDALSIPSSFMGLTILAWGNSVGDFFSNIAVGKQGMSEMAVAGCYGGPIFNIFFGLGMSFLYICVKNYPEPFILNFDSTSIISIICLLATLVATLAYVSMKGYVLESRFGYFLILFYGAYTLLQFALLL